MTNEASTGLRVSATGTVTVPEAIADLNASPERRVLLFNACVISMDPKVGDFVTADVLIEGDTIARGRAKPGWRP